MRHITVVLASLPLVIFANPSGCQVIAGKAEVSEISNRCVIQTSDRAILHWQNFSNLPGELIQFVQPSPSSAVLNRVVSLNSSELLGSLEANGKIFLINPNGIIIGKEATIHCASFSASTLDVLDDDFLQDNLLEFKGNSNASIANYGYIAAKDVNFYSQFFEHDGSIDAMQVNQESGRVFLIAVNGEGKINGTIDAPDGAIHLLGEKVFLNESAKVSTSSANSGGTILIGGDYQGANPEIPNSKEIYTAAGAMISADALETGNGGKVILWADKQNSFFGKISAKGGALGGDGGFVEISSPGNLGFFGKVKASAPLGKPGQLLLDPTDIVITNTNSAIVTSIGPATAWSAATASVNIAGNTVVVAPTNISMVLGSGTNVLISTTAPVDGNLGNGDITVNANGTITWTTGATLTLNATRNISVNGDIQHATNAMGGVSLIAGGNININNAAATNAVSVGSQNGFTNVQAGGNITLTGGNTVTEIAQIGFQTPSMQNAAGPITVACNNLFLQAGTAIRTGTQIGHGDMSVNTSPPLQVSTTSTATITVATTGNITFTNSNAGTSPCQIGHGATVLGDGALASQAGNISVTCGGNLLMNANAGNSALGSQTIGHGFPSAQGGVLPGPDLLSGDIDVIVSGSITLISGDIGGSNLVMIGHGCQFSNAVVDNFSGNLRVCCGGNMTLTAGRNGAIRVGHFATGNATFPVLTINGSYNISVGGSLSMTTLLAAAGASSCIIGYLDSSRTPILRDLTGTASSILNLAVCGDAVFSTPILPAGNLLGIGLASDDKANSLTRVNIAIGGDFTALATNNSFAIASVTGDLNFAVGGNLTHTTIAGASFISSGTGGVLPAGQGALRIYTGGTLNVQASLAVSPDPVIGQVTYSAPNSAYSIDVRSGGDVIWPGTIPGTLSGPISVLAGHSFASGELWSGTGSQLTSVCGQPITYAFPFNPTCATCSQLNSPSSALPSTCGGFTISPNFAGTASFFTSSNLTINGNCQMCDATPTSLIIGPNAAHDIRLTTPSGSVSIGPFFNLDLSQDIVATNGLSSVQLTACNNLNINTPGGGPADITATGNITLISDIDDSGTGNVNLQGGNITSTGGNILIDAGFGSAGGSSSVYQTSGQITTAPGSGSIQIQALFDISIDGSATSVQSSSGTISMEAGHDISILENMTSNTGAISTLAGNNTYITLSQITTGGSILMITGVDMILTGAIITSSASQVNLVVDNLFPTAPGIGPGAFIMDASSIISAEDYIRIYTALQGQNSIDPAALFVLNGSMNTFSPGPLYANSITEMWCTYYPDGTGGIPFRIFYKDCLQQITTVSNEIASQFLFQYLNESFEYPGFLETYRILYNTSLAAQIASSYTILNPEQYFLRRRSYRFITPKNRQPAKELPESI